MPAPAHGLSRRHFCAALCAAGLPARAVRAAPEPAPAPRRIDMDWHDATRQRAVPVRLYWPAAGAERVPLVVFSHGIGGSREGYSYLGTHWASYGHASLHVQHVGSDRSLWSGSLMSVVDRLQAAATVQEASARVRDLGFALDRLLDPAGSEFADLIDARRIAVAGHSYGANTSLLAVGARALKAGQWLDFRDPRFTSAVLISAPPFYGQVDTAAVFERVAVPTLHITATDDVIRIPGFYSDSSDRLAVYDAVADARKTLVVYAGGSHSMFTDRGNTGGWTLNPRVKQATRELTLAFLDGGLDGDAPSLPAWQGQWAPILQRVQRGRHELPLPLPRDTVHG